MIALILPFIAQLIGGAGLSSLTKILDYKRSQLEIATKGKNDAARIQLEREIAQLNAQIEFEKQRVILGMEDRKNRLFRFGAYGLCVIVCVYWMLRISVRGLGLDMDYLVTVSPLDAAEDVVSGMILLYIFGRASLGK